MDIGGSPGGELILRDSNPGTVSISPGGVGRNIAHDLCLLGAEVSFIAALGGDAYAAELLKNCGALGMDMSMSLVLPERRSSVYLYINDRAGDMLTAVSDMDIVNCLGPEHLRPLTGRINRADAVVIDTNIPEESIAFLAENCTVPIYADPVSVSKAAKLKPYLGCLQAVKPNRIEAEVLTGERDPEKAGRKLADAGVERAFISLGAEGILAADREKLIYTDSPRARIVNTTGAGDAASAAIVWAGVNGMSLEEAAELAARAGSFTTECPGANNPELGKILWNK